MSGQHSLLELRGLRKSFGGSCILDHLDLNLPLTGTRVIIGPNGAGKSTLFRLIAGTLRCDEGLIYFDGREIGALPAYKRQRLGIAQSFQTPKLAKGLTVSEHIELSCYAGRRLWRTFLPSNIETDRLEFINTTIATIGLNAELSMLVESLSHADKKKLDLCCALLQSPKLLLLDEPTAGLSALDVPEIVQLVRRLESHLSVLIIEHDLSFVRALGSDVVVLHQGRIIREDNIERLESDILLKEIYFGRSARFGT